MLNAGQMPAGSPPRKRGAVRRSRLAPEARREAILAGARRALLRSGLGATTMDDIASAAGVAKGTPYLYFPSKAELVAAVRAWYGEKLVEAARSVLSTEGRPATAAERLEALTLAMFDFVAKNRALHHVLFFETDASEEELLRPAIGMVAELLSSAMAAGELRAGNARFLASVVVAGTHSAMLPALHTEPPDRAGFAALSRDLIARLFH